MTANRWRGSGQHSVHTGGGKPRTADAMDEADAGIVAGECGDGIGRAVRGIVIHKQDFPIDPRQSLFEGGDEGRNGGRSFEHRGAYRQFLHFPGDSRGMSWNRCLDWSPSSMGWVW